MRRYFYGIIKTVHGVEIFAHRKRDKVPAQAVIIEECRVETRGQVIEMAHALRIQFLQTPTFSAGDIVIYADGGGQHTAVVLHTMEHESYFAFVTSNPHWGYVSREVTKEEQALLGYPDKGRTSYFTPVVRDNDFAVPTGKTYPAHRVNELIKEFDELG